MKLEDISIIAWIQEHKLKTEKGLPLDFQEHLYLYDIYRDFSPNQSVMKGAQVGLSTLQIFKSFFVSKKLGLDVIYTLPTDNDISVFVGGRVNRIIRQNPILQDYTTDKDSVEQKKVGDSMIYYRGTFTKRAAIQVTSDLNIHDEVDFSDLEIIGDYESRLQHSKYRWKWFFGHPSTEGNGVNLYWQQSDQKHWFVKCPHCNHEQFLSWPESICPERKIFQCKKCHQELKNRRLGRWVRKYKNRDFSGYWIPLLIAPWVEAEKILANYKDKTVEYFYNRVLGLPFVGSGNKVTKEVILGNLIKETNSQQGKIVIGLDTGEKLRYVCGNMDGLFFYGECSDYNEIEKLLNRWPNSVLVADQGGDIIGIRKLRESFPGRVFLCHYRQDRKTYELVKWGTNDEMGTVIVDRNRMMQLVVDEFSEKRIPLFGSEADWYDYWLHWSHIYRVEEEDTLGVMRRKWLRNGRDDWVHATIYWRVGMSRFVSGEGALIFPDLKMRTSPVISDDQTVTFPEIRRITPQNKIIYNPSLRSVKNWEIK